MSGKWISLCSDECMSPNEPDLLNITPQKRIRRKLIPSSLKVKHSEKSPLSESTQLNDSFGKELEPIVYTPEDCRKPLQNPSPALIRPSSHTTNRINDNSLNTLCEVDFPLNVRTECKQDLNSTFTICSDIRSLKKKFPEQESLPNTKGCLNRLESFSFSRKDSRPVSTSMPSYMAMTAAAKRKRKLISSTSNASLQSEENYGFAKRIRQDNSSDKLFQGNRLTIGSKRNTNRVNSNMLKKFRRNTSKENVH